MYVHTYVDEYNIPDEDENDDELMRFLASTVQSVCFKFFEKISRNSSGMVPYR